MHEHSVPSGFELTVILYAVVDLFLSILVSLSFCSAIGVFLFIIKAFSSCAKGDLWHQLGLKLALFILYIADLVIEKTDYY